MIWVVALNSSLGRIYSYDHKPHALTLLKNLENPSVTLKNSDLVSDGPGHYSTMHTARGSYEAAISPREVELGYFTKKVADALKKGLNNHQYEKFILCASPHVGGMLLGHLNKQVLQSLLVNIKKNFVELDTSVLASYLQENWWDIIRSKEP